jgi:hypothetical protein
MSDQNEKTTVDEASYVGSQPANSPEEVEATKKLLRKCDMRLLPPLMVIYFLSFMDRTNIGTFAPLHGSRSLPEKNLSELTIRCLKLRKCENSGYDGDPGNDR